MSTNLDGVRSLSHRRRRAAAGTHNRAPLHDPRCSALLRRPAASVTIDNGFDEADGERAIRAAVRGCRRQIADAEQPLLPDQLVELDEFFRRYVDTLPTHRRHVLRHYAVVDVAHRSSGSAAWAHGASSS